MFRFGLSKITKQLLNALGKSLDEVSNPIYASIGGAYVGILQKERQWLIESHATATNGLGGMVTSGARLATGWGRVGKPSYSTKKMGSG